MTTHGPVASGRDEKRAAAEQLIARYPDLTEDELASLLRYLRKEASAQDCALIASNEDLQEKYRQICRDHYITRLRPIEVALVVLSTALLMALLVFAASTG